MMVIRLQLCLLRSRMPPLVCRNVVRYGHVCSGQPMVSHSEIVGTSKWRILCFCKHVERLNTSEIWSARRTVSCVSSRTMETERSNIRQGVCLPLRRPHFVTAILVPSRKCFSMLCESEGSVRKFDTRVRWGIRLTVRPFAGASSRCILAYSGNYICYCIYVSYL